MTFKKFICILLLAALGIYFLSLLSVIPVLHYVKDIFDGKVPKAETDNTKLALYNYHHDRLIPDYVVDAKLLPIFAFRTWKRGVIYVYYEYWVYDDSGNRLWGMAARFPGEPDKWTIEKIDGKWEIVDVYGAP